MALADRKERNLLLIMTGLVVLIATVLVYWMAVAQAKTIMRPISRTKKILQRASNGDLAQRVDVESGDDIGQMANALNLLMDGVATALHGDQVDWESVAGQRTELDRVASLVKSSPLGLLFVDRSGVIRYVNPKAAQLFEEFGDEFQLPGDPLGQSAAGLLSINTQANPSQGGTGDSVATRLELASEVFDLTTTTALADGGDVIGHVISMERTTESVLAARRAEERQDAELEQAARLQDEARLLLGAVSQASNGDLTVEMPPVTDASLAEIATGIDSLLSGLRTEMSQILETGKVLNSSASELRSISGVMRQAATKTTEEAGVASATSLDLDDRVGSVAASTVELEGSITEINGSASEAVKVANEAVSQATATSDKVEQLRATGDEISEVVRIIGSIADQTNLLALNASIEAARAGVHGKGFAVVANEVKALATETSGATEVVTQRIESMRAAANEATTQIASFSATIDTICATQTEIASAVSQQANATREIGENANNASRGTNEISRSIKDVVAQASEASEGAERTSVSAGRVEEAAEHLNKIVASFKIH